MEKVTLNPDIQCKICNKHYTSRHSLYNHNRKYHSKEKLTNVTKKLPIVNQKVTSVNIVTFNCRDCNKEYLIRQSCWKHEQKCKENNKELVL